MSFSNLTELNAAVRTWLAREDIEPQEDDFVTLAEARIDRILRAREMQTEVDITPVGEVYTVPTDYLDTISAVHTTLNNPLAYISRKAAKDKFKNASAIATHYNVFGETISVYPTGGGADTTLLYYARIDGLDDLNPTNWLLDKHPDLYMKAIQCEAFEFVRDPSALGFVEAKFGSMVNQINKEAHTNYDAERTNEGCTP